MKTMERLYERLTPTERFQIAVAAFGRGDLVEVDRLNSSTSWRTLKVQEPAYFDRLQHLVWLALYMTAHARDQRVAAIAAYAALVMQMRQAEDLDARCSQEDEMKFEKLRDLCVERVSHLKALYAAWEEFCGGVGISTSDVDRMTGLPILALDGAIDLIEKIVGEVEPDAGYRQQCLGRITELWNSSQQRTLRASVP